MQLCNNRAGGAFKQKRKGGVQQTAQRANKHPRPEARGGSHMLKIGFPD
jgi:hypothetical protein